MGRHASVCKPCRRSKLSCDRSRPSCIRCVQAGKSATCIYSESRTNTPTKITKSPRRPHRPVITQHDIESTLLDHENVNGANERLWPGSHTHNESEDATHASRTYPNPGFQGFGSSSSIFGQVAPNQKDPVSAPHASYVSENSSQIPPKTHTLNDDSVLHIAGTIKDFFKDYAAQQLADLIEFWLASRANLALAHPFVPDCVRGIANITNMQSYSEWHVDYFQQLSRGSLRALSYDGNSSFQALMDQLQGHNSRLETLGIFLLAGIAATNGTRFWPPLFMTEAERFRLRRRTMKLVDQLLDECISYDCLNDIQLVFQYESFIAHSHIDGDQSYQSWRRLGDTISSILALGYNERTEVERDAPPFLIQLRRCAFARVFSADKNLAIFLGRPPRIRPAEQDTCYMPDSVDEVNHDTDSYWSAICAELKEDILSLRKEQDPVSKAKQVSEIQDKAEQQWLRMPQSLRFRDTLSAYKCHPLQRDFIASSRLTFLHVQFLLQFVQLKGLEDANALLFNLSHEILTLVVECLLQRDYLTNSGTSLAWKVVHYALPASGILILALIKNPQAACVAEIPRRRIVQNLALLVAEIRMGALSCSNEPNFGLLSRVAAVIEEYTRLDEIQESQSGSMGDAQVPLTDQWSLNFDSDWLTFDASFWNVFGQQDTLPDTHSPSF